MGTYFIAKAESKRLKKAKKRSNLLAGRYGMAYAVTYADVWRMLTYADVWRMLTRSVPTFWLAGTAWRML